MKFIISRKRSSVTVTLMACLAFLGLAVYGWNVSIDELISGFGILLVLLLGVIVLAALTVAIVVLVKRLLSKGKTE